MPTLEIVLFGSGVTIVLLFTIWLIRSNYKEEHDWETDFIAARSYLAEQVPPEDKPLILQSETMTQLASITWAITNT